MIFVDFVKSKESISLILAKNKLKSVILNNTFMITHFLILSMLANFS